MEKTKLQWHSGFGAALRITLQSEMPYLEMHEEYLLNKKPLQVDVLIVRKKADIRIEKKLSKGRTIEEIAEALETDEATVRRIAEGLASRK